MSEDYLKEHGIRTINSISGINSSSVSLYIKYEDGTKHIEKVQNSSNIFLSDEYLENIIEKIEQIKYRKHKLERIKKRLL